MTIARPTSRLLCGVSARLLARPCEPVGRSVGCERCATLKSLLRWTRRRNSNPNPAAAAAAAADFFGRAADTMMMMRALGVLVLALSVWKTFGNALVCQRGWRRYGPNCYKSINVNNGWLGAHNNCTMMGADLTSITSKGEEDFVKQTMGDVPFWIGLSNLECHSTWCHLVKGPRKTWSDKTVVNYTNWAPNQNGRSEIEPCVYVNQGGLASNGSWRYGPCESALPYICKITNGSEKDAPFLFKPMHTSVCSHGGLIYGQFCYHFGKTLKTWLGAKSYCKQRGGSVAYYLSRHHAKWVYDHTRVVQHVSKNNATRSPWVGLERDVNSMSTSTEYLLTDGTRTDRQLSRKMVWSKKSSRDERLNCAYLLDSGELFDYNCSNRAAVVCKIAWLHRPDWNDQCGWMWLNNPVNNFCYLIRSDRSRWREARDDCALNGASLLTITNSYEQGFILGHSKVLLGDDVSFWMNANTSFLRDGAKWADGTPFAYTRLNAADLDSYGCLRFVSGSSSWKMSNCYDLSSYICMRRAKMAKPLRLPHDGFVKRDVCMDGANRIACPEGQVIRIQSAFYGWRSRHVCGRALSEECTVEGGLLHYRNQCKNHRECFIEPMATNACPNVSKYLQMVYSCKPQECLQEAHVWFSASSSQRKSSPDHAALEWLSCWKPSENPIGSWIQMDLRRVAKVTAIVIQSCPSIAVTSWSKLAMQHSMDKVLWTNHSQQFVTGGTQLLDTPLSARFIRILPLEYSGSFGLRCGVLGCVPDNLIRCNDTAESIRFYHAPKTVYCSAGCSQSGYAHLEKFLYKVSSSICAAALHAGVILKEMGGVCTLMSALKKVVTVFTQNGLVVQEHDAEKAFTFADGELRCSGPDWAEFAGFCYKTFEEKKPWADAEYACKGLGAELVSIQSKAEQEWLKDSLYFDTGNRWTGLNDLAVGGAFMWSDHRNVTFTDWNSGEPNLFGSNGCVAAASQTGRWMRMSCKTPNIFMCKMPTAFYALGSQADPQSNPKFSTSMLTMTYDAHHYFYVHFDNGLRVNDNITITGRVSRTDRFQVSLHMGSTKVALQLSLSMQKNATLTAAKQGVPFKIVIQCGEQAFRTLIDEDLPLIRPYQMYRPDNITQLHLLGDTLLRANHLQVELQTKPL